MIRALSGIGLGVLLVLQASNYYTCYRLGWMDGGTWPFEIQFVLMLGLPIILISLFVIWCISMRTKSNRLWTTVILVAFFASFWVEDQLFGPPGYMNANGIRDHIMRDYRLDDLRNFARDVHARIPVSFINHGDTSDLSADAKRTYQEMVKKYPFLAWGCLGPVMRGASIENRDEGAVGFEWGGALIGHWGCSISVDGRRNDLELEPASKILRVSDDIVFYSTGD